VRKDGALLDVVLTASPIYDRTGAISGVSAVVHDITARKRIESELRRSNAELEQFAALAAHDLREPFVAIVQGSRALDSVLRPELDARAREITGHLRDAAAHGLRLIDALREYSRVGRAAPEEETIDVGELVGEILAVLRPRLEETGAAVVVGPLPTLSGDAGDLARVLQNLIANAVKFRSADPPRISVSAERGTCWTISVEDNGVGVEPQEAERIFELFARGDTRSEAEGVGIGLAVCRKIVERHGGRIWVEPAPSGGSAFRFTLPG
jgi:light-regulated signal transduction histidine kinase (bacteriophytochrome)